MHKINLTPYLREFSLYLKENTTLHHYKGQLVNADENNDHWLQWEPYKTHKYTSTALQIVKMAGT
jgi:hypothetical protein